MHLFESRLSTAIESQLSGTEKCPVILLAAVSGGADSTAMLAALAELQRGGSGDTSPAIPRARTEFSIYCVHVEHGLRPPSESRGDADATEALCEKLGIPCRVVSIAQGRIAACARSDGSGVEAAARYYRMRALHRERKRVGAEWILTAHTLDDVLENLLMRILRGSGPAGLSAMPRIKGHILRPLLDLTRQDVLGYLREKKLTYRTDSTNADIRYLRNRVRHKLIPVLDNFFPFWRSSLIALAETQSLTAEFLASETMKRLPWESCSVEKSRYPKEYLPGINVKDALRLREAVFFSAPQILREEAIFAGVDMLAADYLRKEPCENRQRRPPRRSVVRRAAGQMAAMPIDAGRTSAEQKLAGQRFARDLGPVRLQKRNGFIEMTQTLRSRCERGFSLLIKEPGFYTLEGSVFGLGKSMYLQIRAFENGTGSDLAPGSMPSFPVCAFPLVFRNHREGDRIVRGGHKHGFSDIIDRETRSNSAGIITVCDAEGTAAFIAVGVSGALFVARRDNKKNGVSGSSGIPYIAVSGSSVPGGADV